MKRGNSTYLNGAIAPSRWLGNNCLGRGEGGNIYISLDCWENNIPNQKSLRVEASMLAS